MIISHCLNNSKASQIYSIKAADHGSELILTTLPFVNTQNRSELHNLGRPEEIQKPGWISKNIQHIRLGMGFNLFFLALSPTALAWERASKNLFILPVSLIRQRALIRIDRVQLSSTAITKIDLDRKVNDGFMQVSE